MKLEVKKTEINKVIIATTTLGTTKVEMNYFPELTSYQVVLNDEDDGSAVKVSTDFSTIWSLYCKYLENLANKARNAALKINIAATPTTPGSGDFS